MTNRGLSLMSRRLTGFAPAALERRDHRDIMRYGR
jgi:hypothetical protein